MSRMTTTAAFAALLLASTPLAFAQTAGTTTDHTTTTTAVPTRPAVPANHLMPGQIRTTQMDGATVYDAQNQNIGDVKDIILDRDGKVAAVVLDVGSFLGMGGKFVAVSMNDIKVTFDNNSNKPRFTVDMNKDQLKSAQAYDLNNDANKATRNTGSSTPPATTNTNR